MSRIEVLIPEDVEDTLEEYRVKLSYPNKEEFIIAAIRRQIDNYKLLEKSAKKP